MLNGRKVQFLIVHLFPYSLKWLLYHTHHKHLSIQGKDDALNWLHGFALNFNALLSAVNIHACIHHQTLGTSSSYFLSHGVCPLNRGFCKPLDPICKPNRGLCSTIRWDKRQTDVTSPHPPTSFPPQPLMGTPGFFRSLCISKTGSGFWFRGQQDSCCVEVMPC